MNIIYEPKTLSWTQIPKICNTNNHTHDESDKIPNITFEEYTQQLELTNKKHWVKYFPDPNETIKVPLPLTHCRTLKEASVIGYLTQDRPRNIEELENVENYIKSYLPDHHVGQWFIRIDTASPKDGKYGPGPLLSAKEIVTSLSTSLRIHKALNKTTETEETLYIVPWRSDWHESLEFRVFVHNKKVTCFSQYVWHYDVGWNDNNIKIVAPHILEFCNTKVLPVFPLDSYVVDVIIVVDSPMTHEKRKIPEFTSDTIFHIEVIEFNSFGAELASGAALFHWLNDYDKMYGTIQDDKVVVRYVNS